MEHRWGHRISTEIAVQLFAYPASSGWGQLRDISVSGGFIETRLFVPALSTVRLTMPSIRNPGGTEFVHATVVRRARDGLGVEWLDDESDAILAMVQTARAPRLTALEPRSGY
jgi:hypothetical protein